LRAASLRSLCCWSISWWRCNSLYNLERRRPESAEKCQVLKEFRYWPMLPVALVVGHHHLVAIGSGLAVHL